MDDLIAWGLLAALVAAVGWLLGIAGFLSARRALRENRQLSLRLDALAGRDAGLRSAAADVVASVPVVAAPPLPDQPAPLAEPRMPPQDAAPATAEAQPEPAAGIGRPSSGRTNRPDLEALLTMRWGVWLGAVALLFAGVFLVRYAVDAGLLGPGVRCALAALLGVALLAGAERLRRSRVLEHPTGLADQAPAALAAGGVAILFGAAYATGVLYGLVDPLAAFVLMAVVALLGLLISLRHGPLVAAVGVVGAFVTPALVQTDSPSIAGLFGYLLFVSAAALAVVRFTAWTWLGWATTIAGAAWVMLVLAQGETGDGWALALFLAASAALNLFLLPGAALDGPIGRRLAWVPFAVLGCTALLIEAAVTGWAGPAAILMLAGVAVAKAATEPRLDRLPWLAALLFLAMLLGWAVPAWRATGEAITIEGVVQAVLPGAWAPDVLLPLLWTAILGAAAFAAVGLAMERRSEHPARWSALTAAVPVLTMAVTYAQVALFQPRPLWAGCATLLAAGLTGAAALAMREAHPQSLQRAGVHAAGAVAALAMALAMLLQAQWLTLAVALFVPALAWIEERTDLRALRQVALVVAAVVLARLVLNWQVAEYDFGRWPLLNLLLPTYAIPAAAFAWTARRMRRRGDDLPVAVLEAASLAFATALVLLEVRHWASGGQLIGVGDSPEWALPGSFAEWALDVTALAILATGTRRIDARAPRPVLGAAWRIQGALALSGGVLLLIVNPGFQGGAVGTLPVLDALLAAYAIPALLAGWAARGRDMAATPIRRRVLAGYALLAAFAWVTLEVHHLFHRDEMDFGLTTLSDAELWAWSGAWLALAAALLAGGIRVGARSLRLAALALIAITTLKVFAVDMAGLAGLWRVLSFLGLGLALIGLGSTYRRFVHPPGDPA